MEWEAVPLDDPVKYDLKADEVVYATFRRGGKVYLVCITDVTGKEITLDDILVNASLPTRLYSH